MRGAGAAERCQGDAGRCGASASTAVSGAPLPACGRGLAGGAAHRPIETQKGEGGRVRSGTPPNRRGYIGEGAGRGSVTSRAGHPRRGSRAGFGPRPGRWGPGTAAPAVSPCPGAAPAPPAGCRAAGLSCRGWALARLPVLRPLPAHIRAPASRGPAALQLGLGAVPGGRAAPQSLRSEPRVLGAVQAPAGVWGWHKGMQVWEGLG